MLFLLSLGCVPFQNKNPEKDWSQSLEIPVFITVFNRHHLDKKEAQMFVKAENLDTEPISQLQILFFATDVNQNLLVPEEQRTPELVCSYPEKIPPKTKVKCHVGPFVYPMLWSQIKIQSISFTTSDRVRHFISEEDVDVFTEWK
ncbi:hypothetical protein P3G55_18685 [Leptospira sp. 96542]|nr:hypothetical protein [Leptospira sp. 96542]